MHVINARNVNDALAAGLRYLYAEGIEEPSRNGPVLVALGPVTTVYNHPLERVLFSPLRDANPFFHFFESLWMLAGRQDIAFPTYFNSRFGAYSDDGVTQRGAYGYRWRKWFGYDQLHTIANELRDNPASRRCVLTMWDASETVPSEKGHIARFAREHPHDYELGDLLADSVDKPCNTHAYVDVRGGKLNLTVLCRSNDIWWGAYGANAVHMSFLQEYLAGRVGVPVGVYRQVSNNYHIYTNVVPKELMLEQALAASAYNYYKSKAEVDGVTPYPIIEDCGFLTELVAFLDNPGGPTGGYRSGFLSYVASPMYRSWATRKKGLGDGLESAGRVLDRPWRIACTEWIERKEAAKKEREKPVA